MLRFLTLMILMSMMISGINAFAQQSPESYYLQANSDVKAAQQLMNQAQQILNGELNRERLMMAADLFIRAGKLFEQAGNTFKSLGPNYAREEDVMQAYGAMERCVKMVEEIKSRIG